MACQNIRFNLNNNRLSIVLWNNTIYCLYSPRPFIAFRSTSASFCASKLASSLMDGRPLGCCWKKIIHLLKKKSKQANKHVCIKKKKNKNKRQWKNHPLIQRIEKYPQDNKQNVICSGTFFFFIFYFLFLLLYPKTLIFVSSPLALGFSKKHDPQPPYHDCIIWCKLLLQQTKPTSAKAVLAFMLNSTQYIQLYNIFLSTFVLELELTEEEEEWDE